MRRRNCFFKEIFSDAEDGKGVWVCGEGPGDVGPKTARTITRRCLQIGVGRDLKRAKGRLRKKGEKLRN